MDRVAFNAMVAQYATPEVSGDGRVSWDKGVRCVIPEVRLYGKCEQDGTPTPDAPVEIKCNNGVFAARGSNLVDMPDIVSQEYSVGVKSYIQWYIDLPVGTTVTVSADAYAPQGTSGRVSGWRIVLKDKTLIHLWVGYTELESRVSYTHTKTVDFTMDDVNYSLWYLGSGVGEFDRWVKNVTVNIGDTDLGYTPYYDGGQAMAPELYAIPGTEYRDEWNPQTGWGVRRVRKLVLDGTENWKYSKKGDYKICIYAKAYIPALNATNGNAMCSHFSEISYAHATNLTGEIAYKCGIALAKTTGYIYMSLPLSLLDTPDLDGAKGYLANQYANGTPVTLFATQDPEPFYIDPARLTQPNGPGQIIQLSGDVADCLIMAKYLTHS